MKRGVVNCRVALLVWGAAVVVSLSMSAWLMSFDRPNWQISFVALPDRLLVAESNTIRVVPWTWLNSDKLIGRINMYYTAEFADDASQAWLNPMRFRQISEIRIAGMQGDDLLVESDEFVNQFGDLARATFEPEQLTRDGFGGDIKFPTQLGITNHDWELWWPGIRYNAIILCRYLVAAIAFIFLILFARELRYEFRRRRRIESQLCEQCGYDMRGSHDQCPECGNSTAAM